MARSEPAGFTPPARYRALNTVENDDRRKVPGVFTSPITFTWMVRIRPRVTLTVVFGRLPPMLAYLDTSAFLIFSDASRMVRPLSWIWPTWLMLIIPSGEMVLL